MEKNKVLKKRKKKSTQNQSTVDSSEDNNSDNPYDNSSGNSGQIVEFIKTPGIVALTGKLKYVSRVKAIAECCKMQSQLRCDPDLEFAARIQRAKYNHFRSCNFPCYMERLANEILDNPPPNMQYLLSLVSYVMFDWYIDQNKMTRAVASADEAKSCLINAEHGAWSADIYEALAWMWLKMAMVMPKHGIKYKNNAFKCCDLARGHYQVSSCDSEEFATKSAHYLTMMLFITLQVPIFKTVLQEEKIYELWNPEKNKTTYTITKKEIETAESILESAKADLITCTTQALSKWTYAAQVLVDRGEIYLYMRKSQLSISEGNLEEARASVIHALTVCEGVIENSQSCTKFSLFLKRTINDETKPFLQSLLVEITESAKNTNAIVNNVPSSEEFADAESNNASATDEFSEGQQHVHGYKFTFPGDNHPMLQQSYAAKQVGAIGNNVSEASSPSDINEGVESISLLEFTASEDSSKDSDLLLL